MTPSEIVDMGKEYDAARIPDFEGLVHWIEHLTGKSWMTSELVGEFIRRVYAIKGWDLHQRNL
jgi:hypothetical protein